MYPEKMKGPISFMINSELSRAIIDSQRMLDNETRIMSSKYKKT